MKKRVIIPDDKLRVSGPLNEGDALWHKDNEHPNCELCGKEFTLFNRRHHCRNCGKIICDDCSMAHYTSKTQNPYSPHRVCKLCKFCVLSDKGKESEECKKYMEEAKLLDDSEKQVIAPNLSIGGIQIDGIQINDGDILTITNVSQTMNFHRNDNPIIYKAMVNSVSFSTPTIILTLTETNDDTPGYNQQGEKVYLQNDDGAQRDNQMQSRILIYHQARQRVVDSDNGEIRVEPIQNGYVYVTKVTTPDQGGGYKHRKNKSKRKNKRSVRRRMSKRSNMRRKNKNKKVTKRMRKSRRHARR